MPRNGLSRTLTLTTLSILAMTLPALSQGAAEPSVSIKADVAYIPDYETEESGCFIETVGKRPTSKSPDLELTYACREYTWMIINTTDEPAKYIEISDTFDKSLTDLSTSRQLAEVVQVKAVEAVDIKTVGYTNGIFTAYAAEVPAHSTAGIRIRVQILHEKVKE